MRVVYTVHAFRYGDRDNHSYIVGLYTKKSAALLAAEREREWRGGSKYFCEVREWEPRATAEPRGRNQAPARVVLGLPDVSETKK